MDTSKFKSTKHIYVALFFTLICRLGFSQLYDATMSNSACSSGGTAYSQPFMARGTRNLIPNGHFNTGSSCSFTPTGNYAYHYNSSWDDNNSSGHKPYGLPSVTDPYLSWKYTMYWRNQSSVAQATNIQRGYMYANLYQKSGTGTVSRNYIIIELTKELEVGREYTFQASLNTYNSMFGNIAPDNVNLQLDRIGFALTDSIPVHTQGQPLILSPFYETPQDSIISLANHAVNLNIIGNGQRYLIIGNFHENDSIAFNTTPANSSHATYAFDALKLFDPNCQDYAQVYLYEDLDDCGGEVRNIYAQHGMAPYTWILDGVILPETSNTLSVTIPIDTSTLIVQSGDGMCISQDSMLLFPRYYSINQVSDTTLFCNWDVDLNPTFTAHGGASWISSYSWYEQNDPGTELSSTDSYTVQDSGTYVLKIEYDGCETYDTVYVGPNVGILTANLPLDINPEHCINMNDGALSYDTSSYPTNVHFYWTGDLISSDDPVLGSLASGTYEYYVFDDMGRCSFTSNFVPITYDSCSIISGTIYNDLNRDCSMNAGESGMWDITVYTTPLNNLGVTDSLGNFEILVPPGTYTIHQNLDGYNNTIVEFCSPAVFNLPVSGILVDSVYIGDTLHISFHDPAMESLSITDIKLNTTSAQCSFQFANLGDLEDMITVGIHVDHPVLSLSGIPSGFVGYSGDTAMFMFPNVPAFTSLMNTITFNIDQNVSYIGDTVTISAFCQGSSWDINLLNNKLFQERIILAAYDPNAKYVTPLGEGSDHKTSVENREFTYTIHFQNTGNSPAEMVMISDTISDLLDLSTFQFMAASHAIQTSSYGNIIHFLFEDINLADSTSDEAGSKGYVQFKIKAKNSAYVGDTIQNSANIYFDNNPPILTGKAINIYYKQVIYGDSLIAACAGDEVNLDGQIYTTDSTFTDTITGYYRDSVLTTSITFTEIDTQVSLIGENELEALIPGNLYQWFNCLLLEEVVGATNQLFEVEESGDYAVIVSDGVCQDTSACFTVNLSNLQEEDQYAVKIQPNPTNGKIFISGFDTSESNRIEVLDMLGKLVPCNIEKSGETLIIDLSSFEDGVYMVRVKSGVYRVVKE